MGLSIDLLDFCGSSMMHPALYQQLGADQLVQAAAAAALAQGGADKLAAAAASSRDTTMTKIFVGGLPYHTSDKTLHEYFEQYGEIEEAVVITDRNTQKSKGYGFVTMKDRPSAERACVDPNPIIDGRKANVNLAYLGAKPRGNMQLAALGQAATAGLGLPLQTPLNPLFPATTRIGLPQMYYPQHSALLNPLLAQQPLLDYQLLAMQSQHQAYGLPAGGVTTGASRLRKATDSGDGPSAAKKPALMNAAAASPVDPSYNQYLLQLAAQQQMLKGDGPQV